MDFAEEKNDDSSAGKVMMSRKSLNALLMRIEVMRTRMMAVTMLTSAR